MGRAERQKPLTVKNAGREENRDQQIWKFATVARASIFCLRRGLTFLPKRHAYPKRASHRKQRAQTFPGTGSRRAGKVCCHGSGRTTDCARASNTGWPRPVRMDGRM
jgi:hypothetical protein